MDYPTLPIGLGFHWAPLGGSWYINLYVCHVYLLNGGLDSSKRNMISRHRLDRCNPQLEPLAALALASKLFWK